VFSRWTGHLAGLLTEAGIAPADAADFATLLISASEGAVIMSRAQRSREPFDRVSRLLTAAAGRLASRS
jgi:TetR/AcrR family transcriptional repressor of lmrAB and yxaGH operons